MTGYYISFAAGVIVSIGLFVAFKTVNKKRKQMGNTSLNKAANVLFIVFILFTVATASVGAVALEYGVWDINNAIKAEARQREIDTIGGIPENPDFRNVTWGMTREAVEILEEKDILTDMGNVIEMCGVSIADYYANPFYCFDDNNRLIYARLDIEYSCHGIMIPHLRGIFFAHNSVKHSKIIYPDIPRFSPLYALLIPR